MKISLAFDVYGTLIDTSGVVDQLVPVVGEKARQFASRWRDKQLEYSFRRGLMRQYRNFDVCVSQSFEFTAESLGISVPDRDRDSLLAAYRELPAFDEVTESLQMLADSDYSLYALSNGTVGSVDSLLSAAGIRDFFIDLVSVDEIGTFKPDPAVYRHFLQRAKCGPESAWLISGNPFDVIGAMSYGMRGAWITRGKSEVFDPWGVEPTITVNSLAGLVDEIASVQRSL